MNNISDPSRKSRDIPVLIDTDPGIDDAFAIMLCATDPSVRIKAITTVAGNVTLDHTLLLKHMLGLNGTVVSKGAEKPLVRPAGRVTRVHGYDGLGGLGRIVEGSVDTFPAWDRIYAEAVEEKGELCILAIGPLTNIAISIQKHPDFPELVKKLVIMGGSGSIGNVTPAAEFNSWVDPEACEAVFRSGIPIVLCGLDGLQTGALSEDDINGLISDYQDKGGITEKLAIPLLAYAQRGHHGWNGNDTIAIYDMAAALCLLYPEQAICRNAHLACEISDEASAGRTIISNPLEGDQTQILLSMDKNVYIDHIRRMLTSLEIVHEK